MVTKSEFGALAFFINPSGISTALALAGLRPKALLAMCNEPVALATAEELGAWSTKGHLLPNISGAAHVFPALDGRDTGEILE